MKTEDDDICEICKKPVVNGEARHGATGNHYDCHYPHGRKSDKELFADMDAAVEKAEQAAQRAQALIKNATGRLTPFPRKLIKVSTPGPKSRSSVWDDPATYDDDL